jgi:hypothetical protein
MTSIDVYASADHWADHVAPIWAALPVDQRGTFLRKITPGTNPVVVASIGDLRAIHPGRRVALIEHGAGQSYGGAPTSAGHPAYAGGQRRTADLFLHPGPHPAARDRAAYPKVPIEVIGCPFLDTLPARQPGPGPVIAVTWHADHSLTAETRSAFAWFRRGIVALAERYRVIGSAHPHVLNSLAPWYRARGIEVVPDFREICRQADILVADNTSVLFAFAATGRPVVVCNAPIYRPTVHHGLRFWEDATAGVNCNDERALLDAVAEALEDAPETRAAREAAVDHVYAFRSGAAARAADVLTDWAA